MNITKEEVQRLIEAFHADPHTADWDDALSLLRAKRDEKDAEPFGYFQYSIQLDAWVQNRSSNKGAAFYTHPAHGDTALLRMALEVLKELWDNFGVVCPSADLIDQYEAAITALRERLGE